MHRYQKATNLLNKNKADKAIPLFKSFLREYDYKEAWLNLGNCYRLKDQVSLAENAYLNANNDLTPTFENKFGPYPLALCNLGLLRYGQGRDAEANELYNKCLTIDPLHYDAIWNYSNSILRQYCSGTNVDVAGAWKMYSYRFKRSTPVKLDRALPLWDGVSKVARICVLAEQGMGDKIMFGRYLASLRNYADEVWVQIPSELDCFFSEYTICRDSSECVGGYGVPFCALAARFGDVDEHWIKGYTRNRSTSGRLRVGLVWSGSPSHSNDRNRSVPVGYFRNLSSIADLYSLNIGVPAPKWMLSSECRSWDETAKFISSLDLVISVDTSIVHLCGSLGVECWMMQPRFETDFRWGTAREKIANGLSPEWNRWYSSVKVLDNNGSWEDMISTVEGRLKERSSIEAMLCRGAGVNNLKEFVDAVNKTRLSEQDVTPGTGEE